MSMGSGVAWVSQNPRCSHNKRNKLNLEPSSSNRCDKVCTVCVRVYAFRLIVVDFKKFAEGSQFQQIRLQVNGTIGLSLYIF